MIYNSFMKKDELLRKYNLPLQELLKEASLLRSGEVEFCSLISAKTGKCGENCRYCAQSSHYFSSVASHSLVSVEDVVKAALEAKKNGADKFAIVTSGRGPLDADLPEICKMIKAINNLGLKSCASLGILTYEQAKMLKDAGLVRYHHNINTSRSYHPEISTTHTYEDRIETINNIRKAGLELCCGVIIGMGESAGQRVEMALELAVIAPESIPFNILTPIEGTPFEGYLNKIDEENILRTAAVFKIANPKAVVRFCGGRSSRLSKENCKTAVKSCVEGVMIGNYLTTMGVSPQEDKEMIASLGLSLSEEEKLYV